MNERGGTISKLVIFLVLLGFAAYESGALLVARVQASGTADNAASEAALVWDSSRSTTKAEERAREEVEDGDTVLTGFSISQDGQTVKVTVAKQAKTIFIQHIGPLKKKRTVEASGEGRAP